MPPMIWGHRGAAAVAPENTLPSFRTALDAGVDGVEFDVQLSGDGVPVVIHDETLDRTTSGHGPVASLTAAELGSLDATAGRPGFTGGVPTLAEVLDLLAPANVTINIELKNSIVEYPGLEQKVVAEVESRGLADRVVYSSFNHYSLMLLASLGVTSQIAVLIGDPLWRPWEYVRSLGFAALHPPLAMLRIPGFVRDAREAGVLVRPWTVNSRGALRRAAKAGVDAVFTDDPAFARDVLGDRTR